MRRKKRPIFETATPKYLVPEFLDDLLLNFKCLVSKRAVMLKAIIPMIKQWQVLHKIR